MPRRKSTINLVAGRQRLASQFGSLAGLVERMHPEGDIHDLLHSAVH
jgi:hypothetical protein